MLPPTHLDRGPGRQPYPLDTQRLTEQRQLAQQRWGERLTIRLGVELGRWWRISGRREALLEQLPPLDFIIGSRHLLHRRFGPLRGFTQVDRVADRWDEAIEDYLAELLAQVRWGRFSVLGHLTLPLRYAVERFGMEVSFAGHMDSVEQVLRAVVDRGIGIECNTNRGHMPLPGAEILKRYRQAGRGDHYPGQRTPTGRSTWALGIREGRQLLQACGFSYVCTFEKMQPIFHKL